MGVQILMQSLRVVLISCKRAQAVEAARIRVVVPSAEVLQACHCGGGFTTIEQMRQRGAGGRVVCRREHVALGVIGVTLDDVGPGIGQLADATMAVDQQVIGRDSFRHRVHHGLAMDVVADRAVVLLDEVALAIVDTFNQGLRVASGVVGVDQICGGGLAFDDKGFCLFTPDFHD